MIKYNNNNRNNYVKVGVLKIIIIIINNNWAVRVRTRYYGQRCLAAAVAVDGGRAKARSKGQMPVGVRGVGERGLVALRDRNRSGRTRFPASFRPLPETCSATSKLRGNVPRGERFVRPQPLLMHLPTPQSLTAFVHVQPK